MGYEIEFKYFEKSDEDEDFNREEDNLKERTVKIGVPGEPISVERVAATIIREYTKQNIWVESVGVEEWIKKSLKCTQTKNGVKIGTKAYNLGLNEIMKWAVEDAAAQQQPQQQLNLPQQNPQPMQQPGQKVWPHEVQQAVQQGQQQPYTDVNGSQAYPGQERGSDVTLQSKLSPQGLQYDHSPELCDPPAALRGDLPRLKLTLGKQYQVLEERRVSNPQATGGQDVMYRIQNDDGREAFVSCHYFRQVQSIKQEVAYYDQAGNLQTNTQFVDQGAGSEDDQHRPRLLYENAAQPPMYQPAVNGGGVNSGGDSDIDSMLSRMDAAVQRRAR